MENNATETNALDFLICICNFFNHSYMQCLAAHLAKARCTPVENHWSKEIVYRGTVSGSVQYHT
jgi:hypothetical protein